MPPIPTIEQEKQAQDLIASREVLYFDVQASVYQGENALTEEEARRCLGWTIPPEGQERFREFNFLDLHGRTVYCNNLHLQRPYYRQIAMELMHDMLNGYWQMNLESIIIGQTGLVLDGKHRLTALVLACQEWNRNPDMYPFWDKEPTIDVLLAFGADETKHVVNSIGIGKSRSLADSLYSCGVLSQGLTPKQARQHSKVTEFCIRLLWQRTGAVQNAYSPRIRHAEALDFLDRHQTIHHCVKTVIEENGGTKHRKIENLLALGTCAGLLYLMGSTTDDDGDTYRKADQGSEELLSFTNLELAEKYWFNLATNDPTVKSVRTALAKLVEGGNTSVQEQTGIIVKGWQAFREKGTITAKDLTLKITSDSDGYRKLLEVPVIHGSIDHPLE